MPRRLIHVIAIVTTLLVVVGTGVACSTLRSFEGGIHRISTTALGGGGDDGVVDILLVGLDSRTDANNGKSATAISIPRDSYVQAPGLGKTSESSSAVSDSNTPTEARAPQSPVITAGTNDPKRVD